MKKIKKNLLKHEYAHSPALLFTGDGIIIDNKTNSPLIAFQNVVTALQLTVRHAYITADDIVVARIESPLTVSEMLENGFEVCPVKTFLGLPQSEKIHKLILKAIHWLEWDLNVQYCSQCGVKVRHVIDSNEKKCDACSISFFPKFSPAVMVLIKKENQILLARSHYFRPKVYSAIAGFIDAGETAEEAAIREVKEEVGLEITNLAYFGTQTWPFPDRFMIAFKANYLRGNIQVDTIELEDARWFHLYDLPDLPYASSISRRLIDSCISDMLQAENNE